METTILTITLYYYTYKKKRLQHNLAVETPTVSLRKFTEQSGRKSHKENQTTVCDK